MMDTSNETEALITSIKTRSEGAEDASQAIHLIRLIPYAGGAIASIITENASRRRIEKICDVLSNLNAKLEQHGTDPERHLSKDQIIEVVHETLQTAATASDEKKIEALKEGLGYTFLSDDTFERKQLFLQILRGCTSIELLVLHVLYDTSDPYIVRLGSEPSTSPGPNWGGLVMSVSSDVNPFLPKGDWKAVANKNDCGKEPLLTLLSNKIEVDEGATEGALRLLDGKGLADAGPNLQRSDCQMLQWSDLGDPFRISPASVTITMPFLTEVKPTPLESSRTKFGRQFLRFYRG